MWEFDGTFDYDFDYNKDGKVDFSETIQGMVNNSYATMILLEMEEEDRRREEEEEAERERKRASRFSYSRQPAPKEAEEKEEDQDWDDYENGVRRIPPCPSRYSDPWDYADAAHRCWNKYECDDPEAEAVAYWYTWRLENAKAEKTFTINGQTVTLPSPELFEDFVDYLTAVDDYLDLPRGIGPEAASQYWFYGADDEDAEPEEPAHKTPAGTPAMQAAEEAEAAKIASMAQLLKEIEGEGHAERNAQQPQESPASTPAATGAPTFKPSAPPPPGIPAPPTPPPGSPFHQG